jgi:anhydro-N-acetylmuramic acid kinase
MNTKLPINIIGVMSGTSLDGVDLAFCQFEEGYGDISYKILHAKAISYSDDWVLKLQSLPNASAREYVATDNSFGRYLGQLIRAFCNEIGKEPDFIGSHGHTIFHEPGLGYTAQIGNPSAVFAQSGISTIADFRNLDVQYGGTGAPLVPIGDMVLFKNLICVNLGGIANLSYFVDGKPVAYDISPFNLLLNYIAQQNGEKYDENGSLASKGKVNEVLLDKLNSCEYYSKSYPKSLDKIWVENHFFPVIDEFDISLADKQRTIIEHLVFELSASLKLAYEVTHQKVLFTGGGTHNLFFIECLKKQYSCEIVIPSREIIDYKEALIFAFLAYLKIQNKHNILSVVTGAERDVSGGVLVYNPL